MKRVQELTNEELTAEQAEQGERSGQKNHQKLEPE